MIKLSKVCAGLLASAAPVALPAQQIVESAAGHSEPAGSAPAPAEVVPGGLQFRSADGQPIPPEVQRMLEEQLKARAPTDATAAAPGEAGQQEIVVAVEKPRGSVIGDIPPELTFKALDVRAFGANTLEELIDTLGAQVGSSRGREDKGPVVLLNGRRVSSFVEIARIPTDAIERMEVFPEELALKYGYPADQKVVNVVTLDRYSGRVGQLSYARATEGGRDTPAASAGLLRIRGDTRLSLDADYSRSGALLESERGVLQVDAAPGLGRFRTLLPQNERVSLIGTVSADVVKGVASTLNGSFEANDNRDFYGVGADGRPLIGDIDTRTGHLGTTLGGRLGRWQWGLTANYDRTSIETRVDVGAAATRNEARAVNRVANADLVLSGEAVTLPAGPVTMSLRAGGEWRDLDSRSSVGGVVQAFDLARDRGAAQASIDLPIASRRKGVLSGLGDLSLNANLQIERLSDFGTLTTWGYGVTWTPSPAINVVASTTREQGAPTIEQLGAPLIVTPNVRTFDFARRETVDVMRRFGGNPALRADDRRVVSIGLTAKPFAKTDLTLSVDYLNVRVDDPIASFPIVTPEIEAAFPERFSRAADGRLLALDTRPVNFAESRQQQLRFGLNYSRPLGELPPELQDVRVRFVQSEADVQRRVPAGGRMTQVQPGSPAARMAETLTSRFYVGLSWTLRLEDEILLRDGGPRIDLLDGSAIDLRGGRPRHELDFQLGAAKRGLGVRISANWTSGTTVQGLPGADGTAGDLRFSSYGTVNLGVFVNVAERFGGPDAPAWMKGTRLNLNIINVLNDRPQVRDRLGATPINYQPAYLAPLGRAVSLTLRKAF